jgi:hypothetical protein
MMSIEPLVDRYRTHRWTRILRASDANVDNAAALLAKQLSFAASDHRDLLSQGRWRLTILRTPFRQKNVAFMNLIEHTMKHSQGVKHPITK